MRGNTISSILMIAGAAIGALLVGLLGAYFVLPNVVSSIEAGGDEQAMVSASDSTMRQARASEEGRARQNDSVGVSSSSPTSTMEGTNAGGKQGTAPTGVAGRAGQDSTNTALVRALRDSIQSLHKRLRKVQQNADTLREETTRLRGKLSTAADERAKVDELSNALMDMRRRGLSNLLREVDMEVLQKLYRETTGSARTRLLQSMEPARAAQFVNTVVEEGAADSASASPETGDPVPASE